MSTLNSKLDRNFADIKETHAKDYSAVQVLLEALSDCFGRNQLHVETDDGDFHFDMTFPIRQKLDLDELENKLRSDNLYRVKLLIKTTTQ